MLRSRSSSDSDHQRDVRASADYLASIAGEHGYDYAGQDPVDAYDLNGTCNSKHGSWFKRQICGAVNAGSRAARWTALQGAAAAGSASYSVYYASHELYHSFACPVTRPGVSACQAVKGSLAGLEHLGLSGDEYFDRIEHALGDPRGVCDEGPQKQGTVPVTHSGPRVSLPGCYRGREDRP